MAGNKDRNRRRSNTVPAILLFAMLAATAVVMLFASLAIWLSEIIGSSIIATASLGGFLALLAAAVYLIWLRPAFEKWSERLETVYSVARATSQAYDWILDKIRFLSLLLAVIRRKL